VIIAFYYDHPKDSPLQYQTSRDTKEPLYLTTMKVILFYTEPYIVNLQLQVPTFMHKITFSVAQHLISYGMFMLKELNVCQTGQTYSTEIMNGSFEDVAKFKCFWNNSNKSKLPPRSN
jgi:hypothetical protein